MGLSGWHVLILALVGLLVFGGSGRISLIMGDIAKGIKSFKDGLSEDEDDPKELTAAGATQLADQKVQPSERSPTSAMGQRPKRTNIVTQSEP